MLRAIGTSVRGARHEKLGEVMQDAFLSIIDRDKVYVSIADGHGSRVHFRSHIGSALAVIASAEVLKHHAEQIIRHESFEERRQNTVNVVAAITALWSKLCLKELRSNPFRNEELAKLDARDKTNLGKNALLAYGTTLMTLINKRNLVLGFSVGDADIIALKDGEVINLIEKDGLIGEETYSLSSNDVSYKNIKYFEADCSEMTHLMLSTDGYRKSFETEADFYRVLKDLSLFLDESGEKKLELELEGWLKETTSGGSGDDITCCLLF